LTDLRIDWRTGKFAVGKLDTGLLRGHHHLFEELGADLMTESARAAMNGRDNIVLREPEDAGDDRVVDLGNRLDLEIVVARTERPHLSPLAFLGTLRDLFGARTGHAAPFFDPFEIARFTPAALDRPAGAA
jgi:hypothetical protein